MNPIEYQTHQLIRELKRSNIYHQYQRLRAKIEKDTVLYKRLNEFRRGCFLIQEKPQEDGDREQLSALYEKYGDVLQNSDVREFLAAEQKLAALVNCVTDQIYENIDIDVTFL